MITVYYDFETGGIEPKHPSIQLAAVAMDGAIELGAFEQKIAFTEADADPAALAMNHYTAQAWVDAKSSGVTASRFAAWLRPFSTIDKTSKAGKPYRVARLAGYNAAAFDAPRLRELFGTQFLPAEYPVRDVLQRAVFYFDENPESMPPANWKLSTLCAYFDIAIDGAHDALADARMCAALHRWLLQEGLAKW
jgi:DNA polymerase III epsilon subunit-like protein